MGVEAELRTLTDTDIAIEEAIEAINSLYTRLSKLPQNQTEENKNLLIGLRKESISNIQSMRYFDR